tara:strand:+ start:1043 stop:1357 length:315 start_codon:yes stop_codon:yes gene_type:complete
MTIFNVELFGSDADWFCNLSITEQVNWIRSNTNQVDDALINEFLSNSLHNRHDYCFTCRGKKEKVSIAKIVENGNISSRNEQEVTAIVEPTSVNANRRKGNKKK